MRVDLDPRDLIQSSTALGLMLNRPTLANPDHACNVETLDSMEDIREVHVVGAAILRSHKCLVARRAHHVSNAGCWEFPGGKVEAPESPQQALKREIAEELELEIRVGSWLGRGTHLHFAKRIILDVYTAEITRGRPQLKDHDQIRWVDAEQVGGLHWAKADIPILPALESLLRSQCRP